MGSSKSKPGRRLIFILVVIICLLILAIFLISQRRPPVEEAVRPPIERPAEIETGTRAVVLYFGSEDGTELLESTREITAPGDASSLLAGIMRELASGPSDKGVPVLPAGTQLRSAYVSGDTAYLDFSDELKSGFLGGSTQEYLLLASLVRTVVENLRDVSRVQILIEGRTLESVGGHYEITEPLDVNEWK